MEQHRIGVDFGKRLGQEIFRRNRRFADDVKLRFEKPNDVAQRLIHIDLCKRRRRHFRKIAEAANDRV